MPSSSALAPNASLIQHVPVDAPLRKRYPVIEPYNAGFLRVSDVHTIYYEECGNPKGAPALFVHGGPGGGCDANCRTFFDPEFYRIVLFDQRGCGKSTPFASLIDNTTQHLIEDIEKLREKLNITAWHLVFGGSWGSTLSLAYAQEHPIRVKRLVLRGIFTVRKQEIEWFYQHGASNLFPDVWDDYLKVIPENERHDLVGAFYKILTGDDEEKKLLAAKAWSVWEGCTSYLIPDPEKVARFAANQFAIPFARIECHYFINNGFFAEDGQLIKNVDRIRHIPAVIVQGRYDVVCPMRTAYDLHKAWPEAELRVIPDAGHSALEPRISSELVQITDRFRYE